MKPQVQDTYKMKAIALDDEPIALDVVRAHAARVPYLQLLADFTDAFKAMEFLQTHAVDLLFLDIKMPDMSGMDFLRSLPNKPMVVFTTAYSEHAVTSFELDAIDYLLKPFSLARFSKACNKAYELHQLRHKGQEKGYLFLKTGYEQVKVYFEDICYLEAAGNYLTFVLQDQKLMSRMPVQEAEALLPAAKFVRTHRSFIVALDKIEKLERHQLWVRGTPIPLSATYARNLSPYLP
jgi:two-component system, LytTR family, response regulator